MSFRSARPLRGVSFLLEARGLTPSRVINSFGGGVDPSGDETLARTRDVVEATARQLDPQRHWRRYPSPSLGPSWSSFIGEAFVPLLTNVLPQVRVHRMPPRAGAVASIEVNT